MNREYCATRRFFLFRIVEQCTINVSRNCFLLIGVSRTRVLLRLWLLLLSSPSKIIPVIADVSLLNVRVTLKVPVYTYYCAQPILLV